jgi:hypothetical protein
MPQAADDEEFSQWLMAEVMDAENDVRTVESQLERTARIITRDVNFTIQQVHDRQRGGAQPNMNDLGELQAAGPRFDVLTGRLSDAYRHLVILREIKARYESIRLAQKKESK